MNDKRGNIIISILEVVLLLIRSNLLFSFKEEIKKDTSKYLKILFLGTVGLIFFILFLIFISFGVYEFLKLYMKSYYAFLIIGGIYFFIFLYFIFIIKKHLRG
ncbi:conserved hypothetical protein [Lebetimonas natsushimae]|uniref:Holin-X, holin superfamily III n=1 Tax=Lebetimonas natsushimae TaxID=1936991 RepID=A0A292YEB3_9BACT|nr:conserved hypothetical protein [Lebetimonas natsushimae]